MLVVIAIGFGFAYWNHKEAEHKATVAAAQARYAKFKSANDELDLLIESETEALGAFRSFGRMQRAKAMPSSDPSSRRAATALRSRDAERVTVSSPKVVKPLCRDEGCRIGDLARGP